MKYIPTRNKNYAFVKCFIRNLMALILRLKVVPSMLVQKVRIEILYFVLRTFSVSACSLRLVLWMQLYGLRITHQNYLETGTKVCYSFRELYA